MSLAMGLCLITILYKTTLTFVKRCRISITIIGKAVYDKIVCVCAIRASFHNIARLFHRNKNQMLAVPGTDEYKLTPTVTQAHRQSYSK